ncbi:hypothetical protein PJP12_30045, partial [Mycobacterium kansasii]
LNNSHTKCYSTPNILTQGILAFTIKIGFTGSPKTFTILSFNLGLHNPKTPLSEFSDSPHITIQIRIFLANPKQKSK